MIIKNGAAIFINQIPISNNLKKIIKNKKIDFENILNSGDDYELIVISNRKFRNKIFKIAKINNVKITLIGKTIKKAGLIFDSDKDLNIPREFDHFS